MHAHVVKPFYKYIVVAAVTLLWAASLFPLFDFALFDKRMLEAFSVDELIQLNLLHGAVKARTFVLNFGPYPHLVFNLVLIGARALPGAVTDARILYLGRVINLVFGAGAVLLVFWWARRAYGAAAGWVAFSLLLVNATLYTGVTQLQPDIAQVFFLVAALAMTAQLIDEPSERWLVLASLAAGLAFACKYSGLFILPIVAVAVARRPVPIPRPAFTTSVLRTSALLLGVSLVAVSFLFDAAWMASHLTEDGRIDSPIQGATLTLLTFVTRGGGLVVIAGAAAPWPWQRLRRWPHGLAVLWSWYLALATFAAAFVVTSPYSLRRAAFLKGMLSEASYAAPANLAAQLETLRGFGSVIGWPAAAAALATIAASIWRARRPSSRMNAVDAVLIAWIIIYVAVLLLPAHEIYIDYALPLVPAFAMLAGRGVGAVFARLSEASGRRRLVAVALTGVVVLGETPLAWALMAARTRQEARTTTSIRASVGAWLQCRFPPSTRIAYDYFTYVPPTFPEAFPTWGGTREWLRAIDPDVVIVQDLTSGYAAEKPQHSEYYECLAGGTCGYELALARGLLDVYVRTGQARALTARGCS